MDMWSDENLSPFMGVTAHRINMVQINTPIGPRTALELRSYLIGFHRVTGHHTGEHLGQKLVHILDRLQITSKVSDLLLFSDDVS